MQDTVKRKIELEKKQLSLKNMYFNRYLIVRYLTAFFFFMNMQWMILLLSAKSLGSSLPMILILAILPAVGEQVKLYRKHQTNVPWTKWYFLFQSVFNLLVIPVLFTSGFTFLYPFMANNNGGQLFVFILVVSGIFASAFIQYRLKKISLNQDQQYIRIKQYEKALYFVQKYLMGPMGKIAQLKIVRAVMAAGMASIPFTIVGSMFLVLNILPLPFPFLEGFFNATFFKVSDLYMIVNTMTMGILSIYFAIVFAYELTSIERDEQKLNVNPLTGALLSVFAFFMCIPELIMTDGKISLIASINETETVVNGIRMGSFVERLGTSGIFTAIIMSIIAVELYCMCVKRNWVIKMPDVVPPGVSRSFTALIPTFVIAFVVMIINGLLVALGTDIFKMIAIPFGFVTQLTNTWLGVMVIYFLIHALWIVGIHGANIITSFLTPIVLANMAANAQGANYPLAGEFNNSYVTVGGSGATLGLIIFIAFLAKSDQLKVLGKASLVPGLFNINEPIIFGMPIVYNPYLAVPFFLAPMASATLAYFAIRLEIVKPMLAQMPWPSPVGIGAFVGSGGDWKAAVLAVICAIIAFIIWFPFIKFYDNKLLNEEREKAAELASEKLK